MSVMVWQPACKVSRSRNPTAVQGAQSRQTRSRGYRFPQLTHGVERNCISTGFRPSNIDFPNLGRDDWRPAAL